LEHEDARPESDQRPVDQRLQLRRDTAMPLYRQLEEQLTELIESGDIPAGYTLPAERALAEALGVSRATVQQCYSGLRERNLIQGYGRHGSVVQNQRAKVLPGMDRLRGFTQEMSEFGRSPSSRVLEHAIVTDRSIASLFGLPSTAHFLRLVRVRLGDGVPMSVESAWYSLDAAPGLASADPHGSIYRQLANQGLNLSHCEQTIEATFANELEQEIFGFQEPIPCLLIKRQSYVGPNTMVEYVEGLFRGDTYTYRLKLDA
jgi:GntR family transcriptional regulator